MDVRITASMSAYLYGLMSVYVLLYLCVGLWTGGVEVDHWQTKKLIHITSICNSLSYCLFLCTSCYQCRCCYHYTFVSVCLHVCLSVCLMHFVFVYNFKGVFNLVDTLSPASNQPFLNVSQSIQTDRIKQCMVKLRVGPRIHYCWCFTRIIITVW